jgi:LacI family transcriptional regulator
MTVSRVINRGPGVREAMQKRVGTAIRRLGYVPNPSAQALAGERQFRLAFLFDNPSTFYLSELLLGLLESLTGLPHQLMVQRIPDANDHVRLAEEIRALRRRCEGVIVPPPLSDDLSVHAFLRRAGLPAVYLSGIEPGAGGISIGIDEYAAARAMTEHLLQLGHSRIGFIKGDPNQYCSGERYRGYCDALRGAGLVVDGHLVVQGYFTFESGRRAADQLLGLAGRPSAIFASNDDMAAATIAVAATRGHRVPIDLSVVGFDDSPLAREIAPRLTTVRQPLREMADAAVSALVGLIGRGEPKPAPGEGRRIIKSFVLQHGESTSRLR